jgi:hypothetical protein
MKPTVWGLSVELHSLAVAFTRGSTEYVPFVSSTLKMEIEPISETHRA